MANVIKLQDRVNLKFDYGKGSYIFDKKGRRYIDGSCGPLASCLGHGNKEVNLAVHEQMNKISYACISWSRTEILDELTEIICSNIRAELNNIIYVMSGSESVDSSLNISLAYHRANGNPNKNKIISRECSYHGNTLFSRSASGLGKRKFGFENEIIPVEFVSFPNVYRPPEDILPENIVEYCAKEFEESILSSGPENVAAFIFEPVGGASSGGVTMPPGYTKKIREICDRYDIILIADEVMCGSGRTGTWSAMEQESVHPDIMTMAKGLSGGILPLGAVAYSDKIHQSIMDHYGTMLVGGTYSGHAACCAAAVAVHKIIARDKLLERIAVKSPYLFERLRSRFQGSEYVGDVRGRGYMIGIEIVEDKATKKPFSSELSVYSRLAKQTLANGLICFPMGGCVDGVSGDHVLLAPPYNASDKELDEIIDIFCTSLHQVTSSL